MSKFEHLIVDRNQTITTITLNRPTRGNALTKTLMSEIIQCCETLDEDW